MDLFLDIETSGLNSSLDFVFLVGVFSPSFGLRIFSGSELDVLKDFSSFFGGLTGFVRVVTFNGAYFDLPFLRKRLEFNNLSSAFLEPQCFEHVDLFPVACNRVSGGERISKDYCCRKMGIYVPANLDGFACALMAKSQSRDGLLGVVEHNALDLVATARLFYAFEALGWLGAQK